MSKVKHVVHQGGEVSDGTRPLILGFLLISGSCGLIYEILWMKLLTLVIGNTVFSVTTVLTAFMGGLALGSYLAGRFTDRITDPLRTYGLLEAAIGGYALLVPLLLAGTEPLFRLVYQTLAPSFYTLSLLRFVVCGLLLLVPTTLMGATLPVLAKHVVARASHLGRNVGLLYGVNTLGAVLGSFAAGFVLIPRLGVTWTIALAALLNLTVAGGVMLVARRRPSTQPAEAPVGPDLPRPAKKSKRTKKPRAATPEPVEALVPDGWSRLLVVVLVGIGLSGVAAMTYQIAWTRVLSLSIGSSVYAFSLILTAFIGGLALGSLLVAPFIDTRRHLVVGLGLTQGAIGLSALLMVPLLGELPVVIAERVLDGSRSFQSIHAVEFGVIFGLILVPTALMGAAVPMAVKVCSAAVARVGRSVGTVYAVNTGGAIVGSVATGFVLIPWVGTQTSIMIAVALNVVAAALLLLHAPRVSLVRRVVGTGVTVTLVGLAWYPTTAWDERLLTSGPYLYAATYRDTSAQQRIALGDAMRGGRDAVFFKEGLHAAVSVHKSADGDLLLNVNGKTDATAMSDAATQLMLGHLPLLLHPAPADVLVIGLGSGMTLGAVERHPVHAVDVVEIEAAVVEANGYFREFTGDVLADPRVNLHVADGRNHLALTGQTYDVIISEPSNPWISGMANLFTREFFELARGRLRPDGVMCQWVHAYSMSSDDFKTIVGTFHDVFPEMTVWEASFGGDYLLIGSPRELTLDKERLTDRLRDEQLSADLGRMHIRDLPAFVNRLVLTPEAIGRYADGVPRHTDDNALLEYSAPRALLAGRSIALLEELYRHYAPPAKMLRSLGWDAVATEIEAASPGMLRAKQEVLGGYIDFERGAAPEAITQFEAALTASPGDYDATYLLAKLSNGLAKAFKDADRLAEATAAYEQCVDAIDSFIAAGRVSLAAHFELEVMYVMSHIDLGVMALRADRLTDAAAAFERAVSGELQYAIAHNNLGIVYDRTGRYDAAVDQYRRATALEPSLVSARMNLGNTLLRKKQFGEAIESYRQVQKLRPDFALTHFNLGIAYVEQGQKADAEREWRRALELDPGFIQARERLALVTDELAAR